MQAEELLRRIEHEHRSCQRDGSPFGVVCMEVRGAEHLAAESPAMMPDVWRALFGLLRDTAPRGGLFAFRRGGTITAMLPRLGGAALEALCDDVLAASRRLVVRPSATARGERARPLVFGGRLCAGVAELAGDAERSLEAMVLVAQNGAAVAANRGGGRVHTDVYELMEERAQRAPRLTELSEEVGADFIAEPSVELPAAGTQPAAASEPLQSVVEERVRAELERAVNDDPAVAAEIDERLQSMVDSVTADALSLARQEFEERERSQQQELHSLRSGQADVDRLERRIAKLSAALEETERRLSEASSSNTGAGVASAFRSVQGLPETERDYDLKMSLLREIVEANLDLRRLTDRAAAPQNN